MDSEGQMLSKIQFSTRALLPVPLVLVHTFKTRRKRPVKRLT